MNQFTRNMKPAPREDRQRTAAPRPWALSLTITVTLMLVSIFAAFTARMSLTDKTEQLNRQADRIRAEISAKDDEIQMLKYRREELCSWDHIKLKIQRYHLGLRPAAMNQIRYLVRDTRPGHAQTAYAATGRTAPLPGAAAAGVEQDAALHTVTRR